MAAPPSSAAKSVAELEQDAHLMVQRRRGQPLCVFYFSFFAVLAPRSSHFPTPTRLPPSPRRTATRGRSAPLAWTPCSSSCRRGCAVHLFLAEALSPPRCPHRPSPFLTLFLFLLSPPPLLSLRQVLFIGVRGVGVETAKNTVLAGARQVTLYDPEPVSVRCSSVFFFSISAGFAPPSLSLSLSRSPLCEDTRPRATPLSVSCVAAARASHNNLFRRCFIASPPSLPWRSLSALQLPHFPTPETNAQLPDLGANFFLQESDVGKPRAVAVAPRLAELNPLVKVEAASDILDEDLVARHDAVVVTSGLKQVRPALTVLHVAAAGGRDELRCESTRQCLPPAWPLRCRVT